MRALSFGCNYVGELVGTMVIVGAVVGATVRLKLRDESQYCGDPEHNIRIRLFEPIAFAPYRIPVLGSIASLGTHSTVFFAPFVAAEYRVEKLLAS